MKKQIERTPNHYESLRSPTNSKDVHCGPAVVPWGWTSDGREGWRLPGGGVTVDRKEAERCASVMARIML